MNDFKLLHWLNEFSISKRKKLFAIWSTYFSAYVHTKNPINVSSDYTQVYSHLKYHKKYTLNRKDSTWHEVGWTKCWEQYHLKTTNENRQVYDFLEKQNVCFSRYLCRYQMLFWFHLKKICVLFQLKPTKDKN